MPNIPCPVSTPCLNPANPITNYTSEKPDARVFLGFSSNSSPPNPGQPFDNPTGFFYCEDGTSVEDAALCANNGAVDNGDDSGGTSSDPPPNTATDPGHGSQVFWNDEQHATVACPDGGSFTYTMRAGTVRGVSPQYANIVAQSLATQRAALYLICISSLNPNACLDEDYDQIITASTRTVGEIDWQIKSGMLPPGLEILPDLFESKRISIAGTPTTAGNYTFVLRATDEKLNFTERTFTIMVLGITNSPPAGTVGTLYAFQFTAAGGTAPYTFSIPPGHLPAGLTSNEVGRIAGTPTETGDTTFTVTVEDDNGNICLFQETISVTSVTCASILAAMPWDIKQSVDNLGTGLVLVGGNGSFDIITPTNTGLTLWVDPTRFTNSTANPITLHFKIVWTGAHSGGSAAVQAYDASFNVIINSNTPGSYEGNTVVIPPGGFLDLIMAFFITGFGTSTMSGTITITCA